MFSVHSPITPDQTITDKREHEMHLNILKEHNNGDKVRIDDTSLFKKGTKSSWSKELHVVKEESWKKVILTDGTKHR